MTQWNKLLLAAPAILGASSSPECSHGIQLPAHVAGRQRKMAQVLGLQLLMWETWLLALAWPRPRPDLDLETVII